MSSKCGINRYKAGGRCGSMASGLTVGGMNNSQLGSSFSAMLAAREAQDSALRAPVADKQLANSQALVLPQKQVSMPEAKQKDIDMILQSDFD